MLGLGPKLKHLATLRKCTRCSTLYPKSDDKCPSCHHLPDYRLKLALKERRAFRTNLGKYMFYGALAILAVMAVIAGNG